MKIKEIRTELGWTQQTMAWEAGVSVTSISNWENADKGIDDINPLSRSRIKKTMKNNGIKTGKE